MRWFHQRQGVVIGVLTAGTAAGQLVFLPVVALMSERSGWRSASLVVAAAALAVIPLVLLRLPNGPADLGVAPYGAPGRTIPIKDIYVERKWVGYYGGVMAYRRDARPTVWRPGRG